jgi:hypothetical protein
MSVPDRHAYDPETAEELQLSRALDAMLGFEGLLDELPPAALLPVGYVRALVGLTHDAARDALLLLPPGAPAANDNG